MLFSSNLLPLLLANKRWRNTLGCATPKASNSSGCLIGSSITCSTNQSLSLVEMPQFMMVLWKQSKCYSNLAWGLESGAGIEGTNMGSANEPFEGNCPNGNPSMLVRRLHLVRLQSTELVQAKLCLEGTTHESCDDGSTLWNAHTSQTAAAVAGDAWDDRQNLCSAWTVPNQCIAQAWLITLCSFFEMIAAVLKIMYCTRFAHYHVTYVLPLAPSTSLVS